MPAANCIRLPSAVSVIFGKRAVSAFRGTLLSSRKRDDTPTALVIVHFYQELADLEQVMHNRLEKLLDIV
jgi:hypothetical protein